MIDPYVDKNGVLKNKKGLTEKEHLQEYERDKSSCKLAELRIKPIKGNFDLEHLKKIHKHLFEDVYSWAGKVRTVTIAKGNLFCVAEHIGTMQQEIFEGIKKEDFLKDLGKEEFSKRAAYYLGEVNMLHPFREGNGRTQREFFRELALNAGYDLDLTKADKAEMIEASIRSAVKVDNTMYEKIILEQLKPLELVKQADIEKILSQTSEKEIGKMNSVERFHHYARITLEKDRGTWLPDTNKKIIMEMMKDSFSNREIEYAMKKSPQKVSSMSKLLEKAEQTNDRLGIKKESNGKER